MSTPGFLEMQLDPLLSSGTTGSLYYSTIVVGNPSNIETRYPQRSRGYWKMKINLLDKKKSQMASIQAFFAAVQGKSWAWRFRNQRDYQVTNEPLSLYSGGTTVQLSRVRTFAGGNSELVLVKKPDMVVPITLQRKVGAGAWTDFPSAGNWTLDTTTGIVTFTTSQTGNLFRWTGPYDIPMRFDVDEPDIEQIDFDEFGWESIPIMEVVV